MKMIAFLLTLGFSISSHAGTLFEQLCAFNPNWSKYKQFVPAENERVFLSDRQTIQTHLELVLEVLKSADLTLLDEDRRVMRAHLIEVLSDYRLQGVFPLNYYRSGRIPVFIDEHHTHCAVGYLMRESGYGNLALKISKADNYIWVKDLQDEQVIEWQRLSGFTLEELKLIQGAYDSYMPFALEAPNRIEIPQKPEVIALNFKQHDLSQHDRKIGQSKIWIRGEGKNGILHGRWEQNYSPKLPWIVGFYRQGKREGKWLEYYQGTNQLCRTEHWKDDKLNGIRTRFDRVGNVIEEIQFDNGTAVLKTNYDLGQSLKFVRKPIRDSIVWTEIYDLGGNRIAAGHELIHNPGNLQWFQNIELTALNTMALASQTYSSAQQTGYSSVKLYNEPPLVEYIKQGDWVYFVDPMSDYPYLKSFGQNGNLFTHRFSHFGSGLLHQTINLGNANEVPEFDSLRVSYVSGDVSVFSGFYQQKRFSMELEWHSNQFSDQVFRSYRGDDYFTLRGFRGERIRLTPVKQVKSYGFVNEQDEKIGKWQHFNPEGQLSFVEEFILPQKKELALKKDVKN
ncbi:hypothetical protein D3C87_85950 [compost metagenome]